MGTGFRTIAVITLLAPITLVAQDTRRDTLRADSAARLRPVSITTSRAAAVVGGASAVIVKPTELRTSPAPLLEQALREAPFVHVRQNSRGEMELSVRGSDARQAAVLLDGVPITLGWDHRTDPSLIPVTGTQRIVIVRGLGSLLNGPNVLGGSVEVSHADDPSSPRAEWWLGGGVDDNSSFVTTLGGARRFADIGGGMLSVVGGFAYRDRDGFSLPDGATDPSARDGLRTNSDLQHADGFAIIRWSNVLRRSIGLTISGFNAERGVPPEEHISAPRFWRYPYHRRWIAALSASTGSFQTPLGYGTFDVGVGYNGGKLKIDVFSDRTYTTVTGEERGDEKTWTQRARLTHSVGSATLSAAVTAADVRYEEILPPDAPADYRQKMLSAGAELSVPLGSRTALVGGLVYDRTTTPETGGRTPGQDPFDNAGWRAGLTHDLSTAWHLHASASQRSRFPALRELYSGALNRFMPNPDLEPETLLGLEAGFTVGGALGANSTGSLQVIGFHHRLEDAVVRITLPAPDRRFRRINRDRIESSGAELLGGFVFGSDRARAVTLTGDAMLQRIAIFDQTAAGEPQRHAENNPEARGTLELGVPLPLALRGIANLRYTGKQFCLNADTGNEMTLDSQVETDLAVERSFALGGRSGLRVLRALIAVDNVSDATVFDQCGLPQPGRTLRLMFSLR